MKPIIEVEKLSKLYRLGVIGTATLRDSVERWWYRMRGKEEMCQKIGAKNLMIEPNDPQAGPEPNTIWALKDIFFSVERGEVIGIIGKNGAGKSTLLKILSRITEPTSGRAVLRGRVASLLEVGTGFHPELTGRENIYLSGAILGMKKAEIDRKFDEIVDFSGVEKFIDTPVKRYSSGMYVRLAFAVAAHLEPEILLVDEVLAVGDYAFQKKCMGKMGDVAKEGRTVLFVSHNMPAVRNLCSRVILLKEGIKAREGFPEEVIASYLLEDAQDSGIKLWNDPNFAPGDDGVKLRAVRIMQPHGNITGGVFIDQPIIIEMEFENFLEGAILAGSVHLHDEFGSCIFATGSSEEKWYLYPFPKGVYKSRCIIPVNFLNDQRYSVSVFVVRDFAQILAIQEKAISFTVHESGANRKGYFGRMKGSIRPQLEWQTTKVEEFEGGS